MKKSKIKKIIYDSIEQKKLCRVIFDYDPQIRHCYFLKMSGDLFLCAEESDFQLDGYTVRRIKDIDKFKKFQDKYIEITNGENLFDEITIPEIDITDWKSVVKSLKKSDKNIIIQHESSNEDESCFWIGKIIKVKDKKLKFRYFDNNGVWEDELYDVYYSDITSVTFGSRYVEVFSKYLSPIDK